MTRRIRLGVAGLGRAFVLMLPTLRHPGIEIVAAADPRTESRDAFVRDFGGRWHADFVAMCDDPEVEAVYISTPHELHAANVVAAAARGKHVLVEKPMAITLGECERMIEACAKAGVQLLIGHSHSYDLPYLRTRDLIADGPYGPARMIHAFYYTDFMYRPRRPAELDTAQGGGVVFSQGAHQVDVVRLLAGGCATSVRAHTGRWDARRPTEGAFTALVEFDGGCFASLTYSGYAHFDGDELAGWIGELGHARDASTYGNYGAARAGLRDVAPGADETALKTKRMYGGNATSAAASGAAAPPALQPSPPVPGPIAHNHFGSVIVSCDRADLRPLPTGVMIYDDDHVTFDPLPPPSVPRAEVVDELRAAVLDGIPPLHSGEWAMATLEVCLAILDSSRSGRDVRLAHQVPVRRARANKK